MIILKCDRCKSVLTEMPGIAALSAYLAQGEHRNGIGELVSARIADFVFCAECYAKVSEVLEGYVADGVK
jgi:hypothetical protein